MHKTTITILLLFLLLLPFTTQASEGIPLQKDVFLGSPIYGPEDLPEQITFTRGQYTVDFEFSQSDGVSSGDVARINAQFTQKLDLLDDFGESVRPKEISILKCEKRYI